MGIIIRCLFDDLIRVSELKSHPKNRNQHPKEQIERLAKILEYQGWRYPVKVSKQSGFVTSGHGRIEAAKLKGWEQVPVNFQDYENEDQEYLDVQSDNSIASWAELDLSGINTDLADLGPIDIELLGVQNFTVTPEEKFEQKKKDPKKSKIVQCPNCGEQFEGGSHGQNRT